MRLVPWRSKNILCCLCLLPGATGSGSGGAEGADCHGWDCYRPEQAPPEWAARRGSTSFCDLATLDAASLDVGRAKQSLRESPLVLRKGGKMNATAFGKPGLLKISKELQLHANTGFSWELGGGEGRTDVLLHEYLENRMHEDRFDGSTRLERQYVFHRNPKFLGKIERSFTYPSLFESWGWKQAPSWTILALGGPESGIAWHRHNDAIEVIAHGWKRWLLYPPNRTPPGGSLGAQSIFDWVRDVYPALHGERAPLECVVGPGDVVYVPENWFHAVVNLADSVAVSIQKSVPKSRRKALIDTCTGADQDDRIDTLQKIVKLHADDVDVKVLLAEELAERDRAKTPKKALKLLREALRLDPFNLSAMYRTFELVSSEVERGSSTADSLRSVLLEFRPHLLNHTRSMAANLMLAAYSRLTEDPEMELAHLRRNVDLQTSRTWSGRLDESKLAKTDFEKLVKEARLRKDAAASAAAAPAAEAQEGGRRRSGDDL